MSAAMIPRFRHAGNGAAIASREACRVASMAAQANETVDFPSLAHQLGMTRRQREEALNSGHLDPAFRLKGRNTKLTPEDAEKLRDAMRLAALGVGVALALALIASGVRPPGTSGPG